MAILPTLARLRQEDHKFRASLNYTVRSFSKMRERGEGKREKKGRRNEGEEEKEIEKNKIEKKQ